MPIDNCINLKSLGIIKVFGKDALKFLQGQLTCDLNLATHTLGAHCNPKGRVINLFYIFTSADNYFLVLPCDLLSIAMSALKKYAIFFKVELKDVSEQFLVIGYQNLDTIPKHEFVMPIPSIHNKFLAIETKNANLQSSDDENLWLIDNINHCLPQLHPETSELFLPHELNLINLNAVSFNKGCFTGQEIVARLHYKSKPKVSLHVAHILCEKKPYPKDVNCFINNEKRIAGQVIDAVLEEYNTYRALVLLDNLNQEHSLFLENEKEIVTLV